MMKIEDTTRLIGFGYEFRGAANAPKFASNEDFGALLAKIEQTGAAPFKELAKGAEKLASAWDLAVKIAFQPECTRHWNNVENYQEDQNGWPNSGTRSPRDGDSDTCPCVAWLVGVFSDGSAVSEYENWVEQLSEELDGVYVKVVAPSSEDPDLFDWWECFGGDYDGDGSESRDDLIPGT